MEYFISDCHFDHTNIIKYCNRPFKSTEEMNNYMLSMWNNTVSKNDTIYFLGDMTFGRNRRHIDHWISQVNGNIIFIMGSHDQDRSSILRYHRYLEISFGGPPVYLVHDPDRIPESWDGWAIHGHNHNNDMIKHPLINKVEKRVNVSTELLGYKPISLDRLRSLVNDGVLGEHE